jgi:hypothetical protein
MSAFLKSYSQNSDSSGAFAIKYNPRVGEWASFLYEHQISRHRAFELGAGYVDHIWLTGNDFDGYRKVYGVSLRANLNRYAGDHGALAGFYYGPTFLYRAIGLPIYDYDTANLVIHERITLFNVAEVGFRAGTQFVIGNSFSIGFYMGLGFRFKYAADYVSIEKNGTYLVGYPIVRGSSSAFLMEPAVHFGINAGWVFRR